MKGLIVISTGRCGTKRLSQILDRALGDRGIAVTHQRFLSRLCNVLGHCMMQSIDSQILKRFLFRLQLKSSEHGFVFTDPLTSTCIPRSVLKDKNIHILHLRRSDEGFASSMFRLTRKRTASWLAHNFIPCWQPGLRPLENALNRMVQYKYELINSTKNDYFEREFSGSENYHKMSRQEIFEEGALDKIIAGVFGIEIHIPQAELRIKSNQSG